MLHVHYTYISNFVVGIELQLKRKTRRESIFLDPSRASELLPESVVHLICAHLILVDFVEMLVEPPKILVSNNTLCTIFVQIKFLLLAHFFQSCRFFNFVAMCYTSLNFALNIFT